MTMKSLHTACVLVCMLVCLPFALPLVAETQTVRRPWSSGSPGLRSGFGAGIRLGIFGKGSPLELARGGLQDRVCVAAAATAVKKGKSAKESEKKKGGFSEFPLRAFKAVQQVPASVGQSVRALGQKIYGTRHHLLAGAIARCVAVSIMFPVDTIKTRLQVHGADCCTPMQMKEAMRWPIYPGVSSSLLGQVPNAMLVYGSYELYKRELANIAPSLNITQRRFVAAMLGDITGSVWLSPWEGTKQRVQAGVYPSVSSAFRGIIEQEGVRGLYRGYSAQVMRDLAFHAIQLPLYEGIKELWLKSRRKDAPQKNEDGVVRSKRQAVPRGAVQARLEPWESMVCGAIAGATSGALTVPLDVAKTRLMAHGYNPQLPNTIGAVFIDIMAREGFWGLTAGLRERAIYIALGSAIFWTMFEQSKALLEEIDHGHFFKNLMHRLPHTPDRPSPARMLVGFIG